MNEQSMLISKKTRSGFIGHGMATSQMLMGLAASSSLAGLKMLFVPVVPMNPMVCGGNSCLQIQEGIYLIKKPFSSGKIVDIVCICLLSQSK